MGNFKLNEAIYQTMKKLLKVYHSDTGNLRDYDNAHYHCEHFQIGKVIIIVCTIYSVNITKIKGKFTDYDYGISRNISIIIDQG